MPIGTAFRFTPGDISLMLATLILAAAFTTAPPADYVLSKFAAQRVVIIGEPHWVRHDAELVRDLVPRLRGAGVFVLGFEFLTGEDQERIDKLVAAAEWDEKEATALFRNADWLYREYVDIVRAVWETNRGVAPEQRLRLVAIAPGGDFRALKIDYEEYGAQKLIDVIGERGGTAKALVYCGFHHGFTRYTQPWLPEADEPVRAYSDRMGNMLRRRLGDTVFLVAMHHPWKCRVAGKWTTCLPLEGAIDCAMKGPAGFDVISSPWAEVKLDAKFWYAKGAPLVRLIDLTDGYIWTKPLEAYESVRVMPLSEEEMKGKWAKQTEWLSDPLKNRGWVHLTGWRSFCATR